MTHTTFGPPPWAPKTIHEAVRAILAMAKRSDPEAFGQKGENAAIASVHMTLGMKIRNGWEMWDPESPLSREFGAIGVHHADDMTGIIFTTAHRILNKRPVDLAGQVRRYQDYWKRAGGAGQYVSERGTVTIIRLEQED